MGVPENLLEAAETYAQRGEVYGEGWRRMGRILNGFFPDGVVLKDARDMARFHTFAVCVAKLNRYAEMLPEGGHLDSAHDLINYAAILEERTQECSKDTA